MSEVAATIVPRALVRLEEITDANVTPLLTAPSEPLLAPEDPEADEDDN